VAKKNVRFWWESQKEREHKEDPDIDGRIKFQEQLIAYFPFRQY
jgi:hypothetical protein